MIALLFLFFLAHGACVKPQQVTQWIKKGFIVVSDVLYSHRRALADTKQRESMAGFSEISSNDGEQ